jgi:hypothetical protein
VVGSLRAVLRHVAVFRWQESTGEDHVRELAEALARLPSVIPELRAYKVGADAGLVEGNWDFAVVADFDDVAGWRTYREHPDHQQVISDHIRPMAADRASVQYEF